MNKLLFILALTLFISCERDIKTPDFDFESDVIVNSVISTDSTWLVNLHYSMSSAVPGFPPPITDAEVSISKIIEEDGNEIVVQDFVLDNMGDGVYSFGDKPNAGRTYQLEIKSDKGITTASTYVPLVLEASISKQVVTENNSIEIDISINDDPNKETYYAWGLEKVAQQNVVNNNPIDPSNPFPDDSGGPSISEQTPTELKNRGLNDATPVTSYSDGGFSVELESDKVISTNSGNSNNTDQSGDDPTTVTPNSGAKYNLKVWAISYDFYQYLISRNTGLSSSGSNFNNPYSNVLNGRGIFAGYNLAVIPLEF